MTKEELEIEAYEWTEKNISVGISMYNPSIEMYCGKAYKDGAEPREKRIAELEKACNETQELLDKQIEATYKVVEENNELKDKLNNLASVAAVRLANWQRCEKENKELKELLREFVNWANWQGNSKCPSFKNIQDKAEQFLEEE